MKDSCKIVQIKVLVLTAIELVPPHLNYLKQLNHYVKYQPGDGNAGLYRSNRGEGWLVNLHVVGPSPLLFSRWSPPPDHPLLHKDTVGKVPPFHNGGTDPSSPSEKTISVSEDSSL